MFDRPDPDTPLRLDEKDVDFLRSTVAPQPVGETADVEFNVCPTCARPIWLSTSHGGTGLTTAKLGDLCQRCEAFRFRHPEVFGFATTLMQARRFIEMRLAVRGDP